MRLYRPVEQWRSRSTFLLSLCALAAGVGNWWRFGWLLGENGGAPFMLVYVLALVFCAAPLLVAELAIGRIGRRAPLVSVVWVAALGGRSALWSILAALAMLAGLALAVSSLLLGSWALAFAFHQQLGSFAGASLTEAGEFLSALVASPARSMGWQAGAALTLAMAAAAGLRRGLGLAVWFAVPMLCVVLAVVVDFAISDGRLKAAAAYVFGWQPLDFDRVSVVMAVAQALFTLAAGTAAGLSFGASADAEAPLLRSVLAVAIADTVFGIAIAVSVASLCFAVNLQPQEGISLLYVGLPYAFGNTPLGDFYGALFFFAVFVSSMALVLALLEPIIATLTQQLRIGRTRAALLTVALLWALASVAAQSLVPGSSLGGLFPRIGSSALELLLFVLLGLAIFAGWCVPRGLLRRELCREPDFMFALWYFALRFLAPPAIVLAWAGEYLLA